MQVTPVSLADAIRVHLPEFELTCVADHVRQAIADSWPRRVDDSVAKSEWDWKPEYDLAAMTTDMLANLQTG